MATVAGIHIDQSSFRLIALDGSPKKHKVVATIEGEVLPGEDPVAVVSEALRRGVKEHKLNAETVGLVVDSGLAAFRTLSLPFDDDAKIEEVLKFEIESELPQWNIDDVIVDYVTLETKPGVQSDLLVTALPKDRLQLQIEACEASGLEPNEAELDGTALFNAASASGLLREDSAQLLVHVGDASTALVLVDGGRISAMRAIRAGAKLGGPPALPDAEGAAEEEDSSARAARLTKTAQRVRREILRTLSGAKLDNAIDEVLLCGHELGGLAYEEFEGVQASQLELLPPGADQPVDPDYVIAYGSAVRELGSDAVKPHLRREELRFTGKFERLELPLAVLGLLAVTLLAVKFIIVQKEVEWHERDMRTWMQASNNFLFPDANSGYAGRLKSPPDEIFDFAIQAGRGEHEKLTGYQQLQRVKALLQAEKANLENVVGTNTDYEQPLSALSGLMLVTSAIDSMGDTAGRFAFRRVSSTYVQGRRGESDYVQVKLDMDFHAEDSTVATGAFSAMRNLFRDKVRNPWCISFEDSGTDSFDDGKGIIADGITIHVDPKLAPES